MPLNVHTYPTQWSTDQTLVRYNALFAYLPPGAQIISVVDQGTFMPWVAVISNADAMTAPVVMRHFVVADEGQQIELIHPDAVLDYVGMIDARQGSARRFLFEITVSAPEPVPDPDGWGPCTRCAAPYDGHGHCHTCGAVRMRRRDGQPMGAPMTGPGGDS